MEIVVTFGIIAILFFASIPVFSNFLGMLELKGRAREIVADLRGAQDRAVAARATVSVSFRPRSLLGERAYYFVSSVNRVTGKTEVIRTVKLGNKFDIELPVTIKFSKSGFPPAGGSGTIRLKFLGGRRASIIVSSAGRIRME